MYVFTLPTQRIVHSGFEKFIDLLSAANCLPLLSDFSVESSFHNCFCAKSSCLKCFGKVKSLFVDIKDFFVRIHFILLELRYNRSFITNGVVDN